MKKVFIMLWLLGASVSGGYTQEHMQIYEYVRMICYSLDIPPEFALSILYEENPDWDPEATHSNDNGTKDKGLWQLNDRYPWGRNLEFQYDWRNAYHSTWIALHHIDQLRTIYRFNWWQVAIAYNCGAQRVISGHPPAESLEYGRRVMSRVPHLAGR